MPGSASGKIALRAGPLSLTFEAGGLRRIRLGDTEVLRRIYAAVRDRNWGTVPAAITSLSIDRRERSFGIAFDAEHKEDDIHFRWAGAITGAEDGSIVFEFRGRAVSTFLRNRIGLCVLHPIKECAGRPCTVEKVDGSIVRGRFPRLVAPDQPFLDLRAISHEVAAGVVAEVRCEGDVFEMEDQRNWTDASYKTYSTPLRLPFPVEVQQGTEIRQAVRLSLTGTPAEESVPVRSGAVEFRLSERATAMPAIGIGFSDTAPLPGRLEAPHLAHVRCTAAQARAASALGLPLEVALTIGDAFEPPDIGAPVARWLVLDANEKSTPARRIVQARESLSGPIVAGTDSFFAELNRGRPEAAAIDGACFSLNPQVHASDDDTLMENLAAQADAVATARAFLGGKPVHVTPVTLRMRANPDATAGCEPPPPEPRQRSLFGAAWTVGSLKYLAEGGAATVTYYETWGPRGVMDEGGVFPVYHVLADAGEFAGGEVLAFESSSPLESEALFLRKHDRSRLLVANFTAASIRARLDTRPLGCRAAAIRHLDETTIERARRDPEGFRRDTGSMVSWHGDWLEITLRPHAVVRIDALRKDS